MQRPAGSLIRTAVIAVAVLSPFLTQLALATGWGLAAALPFAALQAVAAGLVLRGAAPSLRTAAVLAPLALLIALGVGAWHSAANGLLAAAGLSHAMLNAGLLAVFGVSLAPGRVPLVTRFARRLNPAFHAGMEGYTRAVTIAWCWFFALQFAGSVALLLLAPDAWRVFVTVLNLPSAILMTLMEYGIRRRRFPGNPHTGLLAMVRGVRSFRKASPAAAVPTPASPAGDASR